jgi:hypothetical protein
VGKGAHPIGEKGKRQRDLIGMFYKAEMRARDERRLWEVDDASGRRQPSGMRVASAEKLLSQ